VSTSQQEGEQGVPPAATPETVKSTRWQALFREVNEQIEALDDKWRDRHVETMSVLCECGNGRCLERIEIAAADYEEVRRFPTRFVVKPRHVVGKSERIVHESSDYVVIEKSGDGALDAVYLDPRGASARKPNHRRR
jgi:hypothetical protein